MRVADTSPVAGGPFTRLERLHFLERDDPQHIWLLHTLFLEDIQCDCDEFCKSWNSHPLSGKGQNISPLVCDYDQRIPSLKGLTQSIRIFDCLDKLNMAYMMTLMVLTLPLCTDIMGLHVPEW